MRTSPGGRRRTDRLLEGAGKRGLGFVADHVGHLSKRRAGVPQLLRRNLHAPTRNVLHQRHADQAGKTVGQRRTPETHLAAKLVHRPRLSSIAVNQGKLARATWVSRPHD